MSEICSDPARPNTLSCFEAHMTDLQDFHLEQLRAIAAKVVTSQKDKRPINLVRVTGHAATWRGITKVEYWRRGTVRANNAAFFLQQELKKAGVDLRKVVLVMESEGDLMPLHSNSTQEGRALNRRVEITLQRAVAPARKKTGTRCIDGDRIKAALTDDVASDEDERRRLECLRHLFADALCGTPVDGRYWGFRRADAGIGFGVTRQRHPSDAVKEFRRNFKDTDTPAKIASNIKNRHDAILTETARLLEFVHREAGNTSLLDTPECAWLLELKAASEREKPKSAYRCFRKMLQDAASACIG